MTSTRKIFKLGIIGHSPGNGHPYSWSAIFNGYDKKEMAKCPFPVIPQYLGEQNPRTMCIPDAKVTHIWTQDKRESQKIADASLIANVITNLDDMIGAVDGVILARDDGNTHLKYGERFIRMNIPILIDKPLATSLPDLNKFEQYYSRGKLIMSCSSMRYVKNILNAKPKLGSILTATAMVPKYWNTYGIHAIDGVCSIMGYDVEYVQNLGKDEEHIIYLRYKNGSHAVLQCFKNTVPAMHFTFYGTKNNLVLTTTDSFSSFKAMLVDYVEMLKTRKLPFNHRDTFISIKILIAAELSRERNGKVVKLTSI
ncbi:MAG: Gfo/Idh/MocA family oxidoreductase [Elusimicrobiota bacterium]